MKRLLSCLAVAFLIATYCLAAPAADKGKPQPTVWLELSGDLGGGPQQVPATNNKAGLEVKTVLFPMSHAVDFSSDGGTCVINDMPIAQAMYDQSPMNGLVYVNFRKPDGPLVVGYEVELNGVVTNTTYANFTDLLYVPTATGFYVEARGGTFRGWQGGALVQKCEGVVDLHLDVTK